MADTEPDIQAQLEAANARLILGRRKLGIRDDGKGMRDVAPVHVSVIGAEVMADLIRKMKEAAR